MFSVSSAFNNSILKFEHLNPSCHTATALTDRDFQGKFRKSRKTGKIREKKKKILKCTVTLKETQESIKEANFNKKKIFS